MIEVNKVTSQSSCIITNSTFTHNTQSANFNQARGGISVVFSGNVASNTVQLDEVHIKNNDGSGIILVFNDTANGNNVIINDAEVIGNSGSIGGGVFVNIGSDSDSNNCPFEKYSYHKQQQTYLKFCQYCRWWHCCRNRLYNLCL